MKLENKERLRLLAQNLRVSSKRMVSNQKTMKEAAEVIDQVIASEGMCSDELPTGD